MFGYNPFWEIKKIIQLSDKAGWVNLNCPTFTVFVEDGLLRWELGEFPEDLPGFIIVFDGRKSGAGLTTEQWNRLQSKIAIEITAQRKA